MNIIRKKKTIALLSCIVFAMTSSVSIAKTDKSEMSEKKPAKQARAHTKGAFMQSYDSDGDGVVTTAEFQAAREKSHLDKDMNGDGTITADEYVAEWEVRLEKQLAQRREASIRQAYVRYGTLDKDKDNDMTLKEFHMSGNRTFGHYDTNGDGQVTEDETTPDDQFGDLKDVANDKKSKKKKKKSKKKKSSY